MRALALSFPHDWRSSSISDINREKSSERHKKNFTSALRKFSSGTTVLSPQEVNYSGVERPMLTRNISRIPAAGVPRAPIPVSPNRYASSHSTEMEDSMSGRLLSVLQEDKFVLYAQTIQPVFAAHKERPFQEIYVRYAEEDAMLLPPGSFFPLLDECRLLPILDRWVVNRLARWVRGTLRARPRWIVPRSNVNLSMQTLADPEFGAYVRRYVDNSYLSKGALGFELAWDVALKNAITLRRLMAQLRPYACTFTLTGVDGSDISLVALHALSPNFAKINTATMKPGKVAEIQQRCRTLGIRTVAEQIETLAVRESMCRAKFEFIQGFHISPVRPL